MCFVHVQAALHYIAWYSHTGAEYIKYLPRVNFAQTSRVWDEWNCKVDKYAVLNAHKKSSGALTHSHYGLHQCTYEPKISHTYSQLPTGSTGHQKSAMVMSVKCLYIAQQCWRLLFYGLRQSLRICISHQTRNGRRYSELHFRNSNNNKKKKGRTQRISISISIVSGLTVRMLCWNEHIFGKSQVPATHIIPGIYWPIEIYSMEMACGASQ